MKSWHSDLILLLQLKWLRIKLNSRLKTQLEFIKAELFQSAPSSYTVSCYTEVYNRFVKYIDYRMTYGYLSGNFEMEEVKRFKKYLDC